MAERITAVNPIFVVGMNRGGSTLLSNILCRHPHVVAPQHRLHSGCHESQVLRHAWYWGDLSDTSNFIRFLELYSSGDFFALAEGDKEYFYKHRPDDFYHFFFELMDRFAVRHGAKYWTTKLDQEFYHHPSELKRFLSMVRDRYDAPKFIGILRDFPEVLKSRLRKRVQADNLRRVRFSIPHQWFALSQTIRYAAERPRIQQIVYDWNGLMLDFRDVVDDLEHTAHRICSYLNLEYSPRMLKRQFARNTSFSDARERQQIIAPWQLWLLDRLVRPVFATVPSLGSMWRRMRSARDRQRCPLYWRLLAEEYSLYSPQKAQEEPPDNV